MLTQEQSEVLAKLKNLNEPMCVCTAPAGCGKSYTLSHWLQEESDVALTTTTHKALANLVQMAGCTETRFSGTIHSYLGFKIREDRFKSWLERVRPLEQVPRARYLIVDEYSMMTDELMDSIEECIGHRIVQKVVFVGDESQLVLDTSFFKRTQNLPHYRLTKQMRQKEGCHLHNYLENVRSIILDKSFSGVQIPQELYQTENHKEFCKLYKQHSDNAILLGYQNQTVSSYNRNIVKLHYGRPELFNKGDRLILREPYGEILRNNQEVEVHRAEVREHDATITTRAAVFKTPIHSSWLKHQLDLFADKRDWSSYWDMRREYVKVHHSYALTVHKSQGSTYNKVFVDLTDIMKAEDAEEICRLVYVAMSRAKEEVFVFRGDTRDYKYLK